MNWLIGAAFLPWLQGFGASFRAVIDAVVDWVGTFVQFAHVNYFIYLMLVLAALGFAGYLVVELFLNVPFGAGNYQSTFSVFKSKNGMSSFRSKKALEAKPLYSSRSRIAGVVRYASKRKLRKSSKSVKTGKYSGVNSGAGLVGNSSGFRPGGRAVRSPGYPSTNPQADKALIVDTDDL